MKNNIVVIFFLLLFSSVTLYGKDVQILNLKVDYANSPIGIDVESPVFSWQMKSLNNEIGCSQNAYQITVIDETGKECWNSGKVISGFSVHIKYHGQQLKATTRYNWQLVVWDESNTKHTAESYFETGLMDLYPGLKAWSGAKWIGGGDEDLVLYSQYLPVFKISFNLQLDSKSGSTKAGFIYGANDQRLLDKNKNVYGLENQRDSTYIKIELDASPLISNGQAVINVYRAGYSTNDKANLPIIKMMVPEKLIDKNTIYDKHKVILTSVLGVTRIFIDSETNNNLIGEINLNPLGRGGDYIAFPVVGEVGFRVDEGQSASFSDLQISNYRAPSNILFSDYKTPIQISGKANGSMFLIDPGKKSMPMLRTTFTTSESIVSKARLYVTSRGIYDFYINGKRVGNDYFNPGLTQYDKTHLYQTFDVTDYIVNGKNAAGAVMAEGWWSGGSTYTGDYWNFFGDRQSLLAKLVITYSDGKQDVIVTDPANWKYYDNGPVIYGSFFQGEVYDATKDKAVNNWSTALYDDRDWKSSIEHNLQGHIAASVKDYTNISLRGQIGESVTKVRELKAISFEEVRPGVFVYDMGQNFAGVPLISFTNLKPGRKIVMRYAEVKYPELPAYKKNSGMIMMENIRAAMAQDIYIAKGGNEVFSPRFTYHGYRYVEITGIDKPLPIDSVRGVVLSSIESLVSKYETSNPKVNRLWENITWSALSNFLSIPTDCPQRNERLGWSGDLSVFSRTATFLCDATGFLRRHMIAMRDVQRNDGRFPDVAPLGVGFGETLWGSAGITVPWESYLQYGDKDLLESHYDAMKRYIDYLLKDINPETGLFKENERGQWWALGDWLSLEDKKNEKTLFWEAYLIYDLEIMSKVASILGRNDDTAKFVGLRTARKDFFNKTYIDATTGKTVFKGRIIDTQTSYVLPLAFDIVEKSLSEKFLSSFLETINRENITDEKIVCPPYSLMTGFIGTAWIDKVLSDNNMPDAAYRLLQQTSFPSWLYPVDQGATTIWERLNSYTHIDGFGKNNSMNSFNHYSFGAVGAWMYNYSLGIDRDENSPGFKHFVLHPETDPTGEMKYAKGYYDCMYGRIESSWETKDGLCIYNFVIPANTSATIYLPAVKSDDLTVNGKTLTKAKGISDLKIGNGKVCFEAVSGVYIVRIKSKI
jgi:alpha-L-rhamnosidase